MVIQDPRSSLAQCVALALLLGHSLTAQYSFQWTEFASPPRPAARRGHAMTFDEARGEVVLFGGLGVAANAFLADTWVFDGITWTRRNPAHSPPPRKDHVLAYDPFRARIVLVGGQTTSALVDAWEWDGQDWASIPPPAAAGPFGGACFAPTLGGTVGRRSVA